MFDEWRKKRALLRAIAKLDEELLPKVERAQLEYKHAPSGPNLSAIHDRKTLAEEDYNYQRKRLEIELAVNEANRLFRQAKRYGVVGTPQQQTANPGSRPYFKPHNQEAFERMIAEARYSTIKKWVDLLTPILSTVVSILALLIAVLALYLQSTSDSIIVIHPPQ